MNELLSLSSASSQRPLKCSSRSKCVPPRRDLKNTAIIVLSSVLCALTQSYFTHTDTVLGLTTPDTAKGSFFLNFLSGEIVSAWQKHGKSRKVLILNGIRRFI